MTSARGALWWAELQDIGRKPVLIVSNDRINRLLSEVTVVRVTTVERERTLPTVVGLGDHPRHGLPGPSFAVTHDIRTLPRTRLIERAGSIKEELMAEVEVALAWSLGLRLA